MAKKSSSTSKKRGSSKQRTKVVASKRSRLFFGSRPLVLLAALIFGAAGTYMLVQSGALQPEEIALRDEPARGLIYDGKKVKNKGPCKGGFDLTTAEDIKENGKEKRRCAHLDPTPPGVDIRERIKTVDQSLIALAKHDEKYKPADGDSTSDYEQPPMEVAETISRSNMSGLSAINWRCYGTGMNGPRVQTIYVYPGSGTNRLPSLRSGFAAIAKRTNGIFFYSGKESGNAHQVRFATNNGEAGCGLRITAEPIRADMLHDYSYIRSVLINRGYKGIPKQYDLNGDGVDDYTKYEDRKYLIWIDREPAGKCGLGELRNDDTASQSNSNNHSVTYSYIWRGCWNYAEPHELAHMLGAVQAGAPYSTAGHHCRDERDVMCYKDASNVTMLNRCTRAIDWWRLDCKHDTYYRGNSPTSGYLSRHWNVANNRFLTP